MILCVSVHADDCIFSCGEYIAKNVADGEEVHVLSLCSYAPPEVGSEGREWQRRLNQEHVDACVSLGAWAALGPFTDGKWNPERRRLGDAMILHELIKPAATVLIPLGIHHPDHLYFADLLHRLDYSGRRVLVYEDLPYRVMYPEEVIGDLGRLSKCAAAFNYWPCDSVANAGFIEEKLKACALYESQWGPPDGDAPRCVSVYERIWRIR